jgi:hypothetical protein
MEVLWDAKLVDVDGDERRHTSRMGNSEMIRPIFSSKVSWVNLTFRM